MSTALFFFSFPPALFSLLSSSKACYRIPVNPAARRKKRMPNKAVFLDRDGTLITNRAYSNDPAGICWYPGVFAALRAIQRKGYRLVVVSNQSAVARGYCGCEDVEAFNRTLDQHLRREGVEVGAFYYSPYHPQGTVAPWNRDHTSRKPAPGMLLRAAEDLALDLDKSLMVGDSGVDLGAGRNAGCKTVLVLTGYGARTLEAVLKGELPCPDAVTANIGEIPKLSLMAELP